MADFYSDMRAFANEILAPTSQGGLGQGVIKLVRYTPAAPDPNEPWKPPSNPTRTETLLKGAARGVSKELIGAETAPGVQIKATDLTLIVAPWGSTYDAADVIEIDGKPVTVLRYDNIPAAGIVAAIRFIVRG